MAPRGGPRHHHGDLREALVEAGLDLVRAGGVEALGLREVTRSVGVAPSAAYGHFADHGALLRAVADRAQQQLADAMELGMAAVGEPEPQVRALLRLRAVGLAYIDFAESEPGLFQLAFATHAQFPRLDEDDDIVAGAPPYEVLIGALDDLVTIGVLTQAQRTHAQWACWSAVHGFADLLVRGPLHGQDVGALAGYVVDRAIDGVLATRAGDGEA